MNVLVTGATGFVPSNVVALLLERGHDVVAMHHGPLDDDTASRLRGAGSGQVTFVQGDVRSAFEVAGIFGEYRPEAVLHMAAITPTAEMERERPRQIVETNEVSLLTMLQECLRRGAQRLVYLSSVAVCAPNDGVTLISEDDPVRQDAGLYALTKIAGERLCRWAAATWGFDVRAVRVGPVYGPWERPTSSRHTMSSVWTAVHEALTGRPLRCNAPDAMRDWIHARDVAAGLVALVEAPQLHHLIYNLSGEMVSMQRTLGAVAAATGSASLEWVESQRDANVPMPPVSPRGPLDMRRLERDTGWRRQFSIESGVRQYVDWLRALERRT